MERMIPVAFGVALTVAAFAAIYDWRKGEIPNWVTLPPIVIAPLAYGWFFGMHPALCSATSMLIAALVPYILFRRHAMGGGDVKLFGAIGAITGFDVMTGIEIELTACVVAMVFSLAGLAWKGVLLRTLRNAFAILLNPLLPKELRREATGELLTPVRMGGAILLATGFSALPHISGSWTTS